MSLTLPAARRSGLCRRRPGRLGGQRAGCRAHKPWRAQAASRRSKVGPPQCCTWLPPPPPPPPPLLPPLLPPLTLPANSTSRLPPGLSSDYCDDFVCTSSPAVESSVRQLAKDLQRANGKWTPLYASNVEYQVRRSLFRVPLLFRPATVLDVGSTARCRCLGERQAFGHQQGGACPAVLRACCIVSGFSHLKLAMHGLACVCRAVASPVCLASVA